MKEQPVTYHPQTWRDSLAVCAFGLLFGVMLALAYPSGPVPSPSVAKLAKLANMPATWDNAYPSGPVPSPSVAKLANMPATWDNTVESNRTSSTSPTFTLAHSRTRTSTSDVEAEVRAAWPDDSSREEAVRIAWCESTMNPREKTGSYAGVFQMGRREWRDTGGTGDPRDASVTEQTERAYRLYEARGFSPWVCAHSHRHHGRRHARHR